MYLLSYYSQLNEFRCPLVDILEDIASTAKRRNLLLNINGVLFYDKGRFVQVLEGREQEVVALYRSITSDPRHTNIELVFSEPVKKREFQQWNMDVFNLDTMGGLDSDCLHNFRRIYLRNEHPSGAEIARWIKRMIARPEARFGC